MKRSGITDLTRLTFSAADDLQPVFHPGGGQIAFSSNRHGNWEIYVMNTDGTRVLRPTDNGGSDMEPQFSPDGRRIAFSSNRDGNWEIYALDLTERMDVSRTTRLTNHAAEDREPAFSPDHGSSLRQIEMETGRSTPSPRTAAG